MCVECAVSDAVSDVLPLSCLDDPILKTCVYVCVCVCVCMCVGV